MNNNNHNDNNNITDLLGPNLLRTNAVLHKESSTSTEPTLDVLKGKDLVCLYFSASWCPPCKQFTPILSSFYTTYCKPANIEIVYISSDSDVQSFENYYVKMPWCSLPFSNEARALKQKLANMLKISGIPTLIVLDSKGNFVTDAGRNDVMQVVGRGTMSVQEEKGKELVKRWKETQAVPIEEAQFSGGGQGGILWNMVMIILRNPMYLVGMFYLIKKLIKMLQSMQGGDEEL